MARDNAREQVDRERVNRERTGTAKFCLGTTVITPGALESLTQREVLEALDRHRRGDWGNVDEQDRRENERALASGLRLFSVYASHGGEKFWVITEADRSSTTILLPHEY